MEKEDIKCPYCRNKLNSLEPIAVRKSTVTFVGECWSGDTNVNKPRHLFIVKIGGLRIVRITRYYSTRGIHKKT